MPLVKSEFHGDHIHHSEELASVLERAQAHFGKEKTQAMLAQAREEGHHDFQLDGHHYHFKAKDGGHVELKPHAHS